MRTHDSVQCMRQASHYSISDKGGGKILSLVCATYEIYCCCYNEDICMYMYVLVCFCLLFSLL